MTENEKAFNELTEIKNKAAADNVNTAVDKVLDQLESLIDQGQEIGDVEAFAALFALPDEEFNIISEFILENIANLLRGTENAFPLVQAMNLNGLTIEDLQQGFNAFAVEIEKNQAQMEEEFGFKLTPQKKSFLTRFGSLFVNAVSEAEGVAKKVIEVPVKVNEGATIPAYAHLGDAGADLYACLKEDVTILPGEVAIIPTGISVAVPHGYELQIRPRSGLSAKTKLRVANAPGTIDSGYRGEIGVIIENIAAPIADITYDFDENGKPVITSILHGESYTIHNGDRIAQAVLSEVPLANFVTVESLPDLLNDTRGEGGFGSTGE